MKSWIRQLLRRPATIRRTPCPTARPGITILEDRVVPTIAIGATPPFNAPFTITEGNTVSITGTWQDTNATATAFGLDTSPAAATLAVTNITTNLLSSVPFRDGTFSFDYTPVDGVTNVGIPPVNSYQIFGFNDKAEFSSPVLIQPRILNAAPVISVAPANQFALTGVATKINLGTFTDKGINDQVTMAGWQLEIDWDNDGTYDQTAYYPQASAMLVSKTFSGPGVNTAKIRVTDKDAAAVVSGTFTISVSDYAAATFVNDDWASLANGTVLPDVNPAPGLQPGTVGFNAFGTIGGAVNFTAEGGTITVHDGTYLENLTLSKSVAILGPNAGITGNGTRLPEAIVRTPASAFAVITVVASDVTIGGLLIDGDAPTVGSPVYSGADANVFYGITNGNTSGGVPINNLLVQNNIIQRAAIGVFGNSDADLGAGVTLVPSTGNVIDGNLLRDIGVFDFGYAISMRNDFNANVTNNVMRRVHTGIIVNNNASAAPGSQNYTGNDIQSYAGGAWFNQAYGSAQAITVDDNTLSTATTDYLGAPLAPAANNLGILITGGPGYVGGTFTNNAIANHDYGIIVWGTDKALTFGSTNSIDNAGTAVYVTNNVGFNPMTTTSLGPVGTPSDVTLDGLVVTNAKTIGIRLRGDSGSGTVTAALTNATAISAGSATATGLQLAGPNAILAGTTLGNTIFSGFSGSSQYVQFLSSAYGGAIVAGGDAKFNGVIGNAATVAQAQAIEDRLTHATDLGTSVGFIQTASGHIYANALSTSGSVSSAAVNDFTTLANSIAILGLSPSLRTIYHKGTFDFTDVHAAASWAAASYRLAVPGAINNLTLTAGAIGDAAFEGPGDLTTANLERVFSFAGGSTSADDNQNLTISKLTFLDFDLAVGMFNSSAGTNAFDGMTFTGNMIRIPADSTADFNQNIGLHYSFGNNITISNNTIEIDGTGLSDTPNSLNSTSIGMQSNTSGGAYEGLLITGNLINVTGPNPLTRL